MRLFITCLALAAVACNKQPALLTDARAVELTHVLQREVARSVDAEKSAVLALTDEESVRHADEAKEAAAKVERARAELRGLITEAARPSLDAFDAAWAKVAQVDAQLLPLATANTNLKAAKLSTTEATQTLTVVLDALEKAQAKAQNPLRLRELARASSAALWVQALHAPHINEEAAEVMGKLETRIAALEAQVDAVVTAKAFGDEVVAAWQTYKQQTATVLELSRANTNLISYSISIHEKRDASLACDAALQALSQAVELRAAPTR
jgi:hypothetical protein